jgi:hypothetical protein
LKRCDADAVSGHSSTRNEWWTRWHFSSYAKLRKESAMQKTFETISEAIRSTRHPFRKADNRPKKSQKHRYERRKIKEYLHLADWMMEEAI